MLINLTLLKESTSSTNPGFQAIVRIENLSGTFVAQRNGYLPPVPPSLREAFERWQKDYFVAGARSELRFRDLSITSLVGESTRITPIRSDSGSDSAESLRIELNSWLNSAGENWQDVRDLLIKYSPDHNGRSVDTRVFLQFNDPYLLKLPWLSWNVFEKRYSGAEFAFLTFDQTIQKKPPSGAVEILVVEGNNKGIEDGTAADLETIKSLESRGAKIKILHQPTPEELVDELGQRSYEIFIFTGHSRSEQGGAIGRLELNNDPNPIISSITISKFRDNLRAAVKRGLQICIFNSCDGLGISHQLVDGLRLPIAIVMRQPVPDKVAVRFLKEFFRHFAVEDKSLFDAFQQAKLGIEGYSNSLPGVTWLPAICASSLLESPTWQQLRGESLPKPSLWNQLYQIWRQKKWLILALLAILVAASIIITSIQKIPVGETLSPTGLINPEELISAGENSELYGSKQLSEPYETLKNRGIQQFTEERYGDARDTFEKIFWGDPEEDLEPLRDPEILIFKNNAEVRERRKANETTYTIAAAIPLSDQSGGDLNVGIEMLRGIAQAQDMAVNPQAPDAERINLEVVIANDRNLPAQAIEIAEKLVQEVEGQAVLAVIGHYLSTSTCEALKEVYGPSQIVVISPLSTITDLREDCGRFNTFFRTTSSTEIETETLFSHLISSPQVDNVSEVAIFYTEGEDYSSEMFDEFRGKLRSQEIYWKSFDLSKSDFDADTALANTQDVDALIVIPDGRNSSSEAFDNAVEVLKANRGEKMILGSNPLYTKEEVVDEVGIEYLENSLFIATDWHSQCAPEGFIVRANEYWSGGVNRTTALPYEAVQVLLSTLEEGIDSEGIQQKLSELGTGNASVVKSDVFDDKTISFDGNGDRQELTERILTTVGNDSNNPFIVVGDVNGCPQ
jgi:ABC-type branched-subunit amino acid transport system substrate-binding protein